MHSIGHRQWTDKNSTNTLHLVPAFPLHADMLAENKLQNTTQLSEFSVMIVDSCKTALTITDTNT